MRYTHLAPLALAVLVAGGCDSNSNTTQTATATLAPTATTGGNNVAGTVSFKQDGNTLTMQLALMGASAGQHGFHIHTVGSCAAGVDPGEGTAPIPAGTALGHFDPLATKNHGAPTDPTSAKHAGDLGNVTAGSDGRINTTVTTTAMSLTGTNPIAGRAVMLHSGQDDLTSDPGGMSGTRVGCGVISSATTVNN